MVIVSDTSPICNLAIIGKLELLRERYTNVLIPPGVNGELQCLGNFSAVAAIKDALANEWLSVYLGPVPFLQMPGILDSGEAEAISLAMHLKADFLLMDEKLGRAAARHFNLQTSGVLGELIYAHKRGKVLDLSIEIKRLKTEARFYIHAELERLILQHGSHENL